MLRFLFPRLFGNFKEGAIIHAKFVVSAGPVYTLKTNNAAANYPLTLANGGTGLLTLTLPVNAGVGVRNIAVLNASHVNVATPGTATTMLKLYPTAITPSTGVVTFSMQNSANPEVLAPAANTDELHFCLYVDK